MKAAIHYLVRARLIIGISDGNLKFLEVEEKFENENPIIARREAFDHYQNYFDVLTESQVELKTNDKSVEEILNLFVKPGILPKQEFNSIDKADTVKNGMGIFMVVNKPIEKVIGDNPNETEENPEYDFNLVFQDPTGMEFILHGFGNISNVEDPNKLMFGLDKEFEYYQHYNYPTDEDVVRVAYCDREEWIEGYRDDEPGIHFILNTPFDWTGKDKPYWWGFPEKEEFNYLKKAPASVDEIIKTGENNQIEFKPALLYNFKTRRAGIGVKYIIAKAICGFLNSNGGFLVIGVSDDAKVIGLDSDFSLSDKKNVIDFFLLEFDQMMNHFFTLRVISSVSGNIYQMNGKYIFVVTVTPSKRTPVFLNGQNGKEFWIRTEASTRQIIDIEDISNYSIEKWGQNN